MTPLTSNRLTTSINSMLSLSFAHLSNKETTSSKKYSSYTFVSKNSSRKSLTKLFSMDWDLNMNELEFE